MKSLANDLLDSSAAAAFDGPTMARPAAVKASATPRLSGSSGPTTVKSMRSRSAIASSCAGLVRLPGTHCATAEIPGLPGVQTMADTSRSRASFHAMACSRAPEPMIRIFMDQAKCLRERELAEACTQRHGLQTISLTWCGLAP